jgi:predicted nucleic acid-binding protein
VSRFLLDTNHFSNYLDRRPGLTERIKRGLESGNRFGICLPVLCEYRAGMGIGRRYQRNLARVQTAMEVFRIWPCDEHTAAEFGRLFGELRAVGRGLTPFDLLIAAAACQYNLTLLTADKDFEPVPGLRFENWLSPGG